MKLFENYNWSTFRIVTLLALSAFFVQPYYKYFNRIFVCKKSKTTMKINKEWYLKNNRKTWG